LSLAWSEDRGGERFAALDWAPPPIQ